MNINNLLFSSSGDALGSLIFDFLTSDQKLE